MVLGLTLSEHLYTWVMSLSLSACTCMSPSVSQFGCLCISVITNFFCLNLTSFLLLLCQSNCLLFCQSCLDLYAFCYIVSLCLCLYVNLFVSLSYCLSVSLSLCLLMCVPYFSVVFFIFVSLSV